MTYVPVMFDFVVVSKTLLRSDYLCSKYVEEVILLNKNVFRAYENVLRRCLCNKLPGIFVLILIFEKPNMGLQHFRLLGKIIIYLCGQYDME